MVASIITRAREIEKEIKRHGMEKMLSGCDSGTARVLDNHCLPCLVMAQGPQTPALYDHRNKCHGTAFLGLRHHEGMYSGLLLQYLSTNWLLERKKRGALCKSSTIPLLKFFYPFSKLNDAFQCRP